jgi:hypothetical protein
MIYSVIQQNACNVRRFSVMTTLLLLAVVDRRVEVSVLRSTAAQVLWCNALESAMKLTQDDFLLADRTRAFKAIARPRKPCTFL